MRLHRLQVLKLLAFLSTATLAAPADSGIEAEDDPIARAVSCSPTQAKCWSDGYNGVPVGSFSFILDTIDSCSVTIKTQEYPNKGRVYKLDSNGTVGCGNRPSPLPLPWTDRTCFTLVVARPHRENTDDELLFQNRNSPGSSRSV